MAMVGSSLGPRPEMVLAIARIRAAGLRTAALTNNWTDADRRSTPHSLHDMLEFDVIVESAREGLRKPDPHIYALTIARLDVLASESVFLDDLGINLKPARAMGMTTIKVHDPDQALTDLEHILGFEVH
jgi:epoxide hydrolase-like predicted phosphatase